MRPIGSSGFPVVAPRLDALGFVLIHQGSQPIERSNLTSQNEPYPFDGLTPSLLSVTLGRTLRIGTPAVLLGRPQSRCETHAPHRIAILRLHRGVGLKMPATLAQASHNGRTSLGSQYGLAITSVRVLVVEGQLVTTVVF